MMAKETLEERYKREREERDKEWEESEGLNRIAIAAMDSGKVGSDFWKKTCGGWRLKPSLITEKHVQYLALLIIFSMENWKIHGKIRFESEYREDEVADLLSMQGGIIRTIAKKTPNGVKVSFSFTPCIEMSFDHLEGQKPRWDIYKRVFPLVKKMIESGEEKVF
jgi:hypothetical protein